MSLSGMDVRLTAKECRCSIIPALLADSACSLEIGIVQIVEYLNLQLRGQRLELGHHEQSLDMPVERRRNNVKMKRCVSLRVMM